MIDFDTGARAYIEFVLDHLDIAPSALAKQASIASTTLTRFLNDKQHKFRLSTYTIDKIARATNLDPGPFLDGGKRPELRSVLAQETENGVSYAPVAEVELAIGVWRAEKHYRDTRVSISFLLPPPHLDGSGFYAYVNDQSAITLARHGDYIYCLRCDDNFDPWIADLNKRVIVEHRTQDKALVEHSIRVCVPEGEVVKLVPLNTEAKFADDVIDITRQTIEAGIVSFLGVAVCVIKPISGLT